MPAVRLALKAPDVPDFSSGIVGFDLPLALGDTVKFEGNPKFAHGPHYADLGRRRQRENDPFQEQATSCLSMAFGAPKAVDKAFWLRFAGYWLELERPGARA
jgi:hypothetical protein